MKKVLALLFAIALCVSMSSFAFAQGDKSACKPMDKMDKPMDKKEVKRHHKYHKKEKKEEMKKDEMKKDEPK
jgi:pentapeptide MXKDX repeat protein